MFSFAQLAAFRWTFSGLYVKRPGDEGEKEAKSFEIVEVEQLSLSYFVCKISVIPFTAL